MNRVLLFGGSFDPIHHGHLIVARHAAEQLDVERVILIPSAVPPHKQDRSLAPAKDRLEMCRRAVQDDPQFVVSEWELGQAGPNYTLRTIEHFRTELGTGPELCWLIGADSLVELHTWYNAPTLVDACRIVTVARPGFTPPPATELVQWFEMKQVERLLADVIIGPHIDIASTDVRTRVRSGLSVRYLIPDAVDAYIAAQQLYRA